MGTVGRDLYNTTHTHIYTYIYAYYYTYTTEGMNMQLCWLYLLFLMFTEDWFWHVLTHSQMAWRLTFAGCLLTSCPEASASKQFCLAEHTEIGCAKRYCVFYFGVLLAGALCAHHSCCRVPTFFVVWKNAHEKHQKEHTFESKHVQTEKHIKLLLLSGTYLQFSYFEFIG